MALLSRVGDHERFAVFDRLPLAVVWFEPDSNSLGFRDYRVRHVSERAAHEPGLSFSNGDLVSQGMLEGAIELIALLDRALAAPAPVRGCVGDPSRGPVFDVRASNDDGNVCATFADVTSRERTLKVLREREGAHGLQAALLARTHDAVLVWELGGNLVYFNEGAEALYGHVPREAFGRNVDALLGHQPLFEHEARTRQLEREGAWDGELVRRAKGGRALTVESRQVLRRHGGSLHVMAIERDVTERRTAVLALERADRHKDEFLAMLGHELGNPLAPIQAATASLKALAEGEGRSPHATELLGVLERQTEQLARLVDDLRDLSRIRCGKIKLDCRVASAVAVLSHAVETSRPLIEARGHTLTVSLPDASLLVEVDAGRLSQVVVNLLNNAAKYTEPGGHIALRAHAEGKELVLSVEDDGCGIPGPFAPHMFERFCRGPRSAEQAPGGLGLGLALVAQLVEMFGGAIEGKGNAPRPGSTFVARLPIVHRVSGVVRVRPAPMGPSPGPHKVAPEARLKVLVVDDHPDAAECLAVYLSLMGHETRTANDGEQAVREACALVPDVVLLDIGLPGADGFEVARRIRAQPELGRTRIIALTGFGRQDDRRRALEAGFDDHLTKPVPPDELAAAIACPPRWGALTRA